MDNNNKRCRNFLDKFRQNLGIKETVEELFDNVIKKGGSFVLAKIGDLGAGVRGVSHYGKKGRDVGFRPSTIAATYINVAIHELIHRAGIGSHIKFAKAGFNSLTEDEKNFNPLPTDDDVKKTNKENKKAGIKDRTNLDIESSTYFSRLMNKYCGF